VKLKAVIMPQVELICCSRKRINKINQWNLYTENTVKSFGSAVGQSLLCDKRRPIVNFYRPYRVLWNKGVNIFWIKDFNILCAIRCTIFVALFWNWINLIISYWIIPHSFLFLSFWSIGHPWNVLFHFSFLILRQSVGLLGPLWTGDQPIARPLPTQTQNKGRHTSMPWVGFEPMIPKFERAKKVHALDAQQLWSTEFHLRTFIMKLSLHVPQMQIKCLIAIEEIRSSAYTYPPALMRKTNNVAQPVPDSGDWTLSVKPSRYEKLPLLRFKLNDAHFF
jgi:hypothetical protein